MNEEMQEATDWLDRQPRAETGQRVEWCETHEAQQVGFRWDVPPSKPAEAICWKAQHQYDDHPGSKPGPCSIVSKSLSDLPTTRGDQISVERVHKLKTHPALFRDIKEGWKTFEVRRDDRGFRQGDTLELHEWPVSDATCESDKHYEPCRRHDVISVRVRYIFRGGEYGIEPGYVVMGLDNNEPEVVS